MDDCETVITEIPGLFITTVFPFTRLATVKLLLVYVNAPGEGLIGIGSPKDASPYTLFGTVKLVIGGRALAITRVAEISLEKKLAVSCCVAVIITLPVPTILMSPPETVAILVLPLT